MPTTSSPLELGIVGVALIVMWRGLGILSDSLAKKREVREDERSYAELGQLIKSIHDYTLRAQRSEDSGRHSCFWHSRDEVILLTTTMQAILKEIVGLRNDLKSLFS